MNRRHGKIRDMPELPEVETVKRQLLKVVRRQKIVRIKVLRSKSFNGVKKQVIGKRIKNVDRKAKLLIVELEDSPKKYLLIHLKMTGQLVYLSGSKRVVGGHPTPDWVNKLPSKHTRVVIELEKGTLFFNDMRVFGWIRVMDSGELKRELDKYGPDVVSKEFNLNYLQKILKSSKRTVKLILLDQAKVAGLGNIYVNDGLFCAKIHPEVKGNKLAEDEERINKLYICLKRVIGRGIKYRGASDTNYVHLNGLGGTYQEHFLVYKQNGKPCQGCGARIKKIKLGGRGTYFCPKCQTK